MDVQRHDLFEALWRFQHLAVNRYGGHLAGEVLMVLTIMVLHRAGEHPTISELAKLVGLPKSTISRYVSNQLKVGHLQEKVAAQDRRRRVLLPTAAGIKEMEWLEARIAALADFESDDADDPVNRLMKFANSA